MKPIVIQSHERPIAQVRYNREGDLLFTSSRDGNCPVAVFFSDNGERLGTYKGHTGAVVNLDVTRDSRWLLTAGQDSSLRLWDVQTGAQLAMWDTGQPARACAFSKADPRFIAYTVDAFGKILNPAIRFVRVADSPEESRQEPVLQIDLPRGQRCQRIVFTDCDEVLVTAHEDGSIRRFAVATGEQLHSEPIHTAEVTDMQLAPNGEFALTSSKDKTAKIVDLQSLKVIRTYKHIRPVNSAALSPFDHIALVGGQDASEVTTTADAAGGFETHFFHKIYEEEFGKVRGHFGPVNSVSISPDGKSFVTGGEDGFVRLQHFDMDYLTTNFFVEA